jgi:hypothetical protein
MSAVAAFIRSWTAGWESDADQLFLESKVIVKKAKYTANCRFRWPMLSAHGVALR